MTHHTHYQFLGTESIDISARKCKSISFNSNVRMHHVKIIDVFLAIISRILAQSHSGQVEPITRLCNAYWEDCASIGGGITVTTYFSHAASHTSLFECRCRRRLKWIHAHAHVKCTCRGQYVVCHDILC